jgi:hypothetical protein
VGRLVEVGTLIRITRRYQVRNVAIQLHNCGYQYERDLKTERYVCVQVVLLLTLIQVYQDLFHEGISKYGGGDTSESS